MSEQGQSQFRFDADVDGGGVVHDILISNAVTGFFKDPYISTFTSPDFRRDLAQQLERAARAGLGAELAQAKRAFLEGLDETAVSEIMLEVIQSEVVSQKDYLKVLTRLTEISKALVDRGRFEAVLNIYNTLYPQTLGGRFQTEAQSTIQYFFRSEPFLSSFLKALRVWGPREWESGVRLARALKPEVIPLLLDRAMGESDAAARKYLLHVLAEMRSDVLPEVLGRLGSSNEPAVVRTLLYLVRKCGSYRNADQLKSLLKHANPAIQTAAVRTLLHFRAGEAVPHLKVFLQSADPALRSEAIDLAGIYQVKEAVSILARDLEGKGLFGGKAAEKIAVVRALGRIGDPAAADVLYKVVTTRTLFRKGQLEELKAEVYRNLKSFPLDAIEPILEVGVKSKNPEIQSISRDLLTAFYATKQKGSDA